MCTLWPVSLPWESWVEGSSQSPLRQLAASSSWTRSSPILQWPGRLSHIIKYRRINKRVAPWELNILILVVDLIASVGCGRYFVVTYAIHLAYINSLTYIGGDIKFSSVSKASTIRQHLCMIFWLGPWFSTDNWLLELKSTSQMWGTTWNRALVHVDFARDWSLWGNDWLSQIKHSHECLVHSKHWHLSHHLLLYTKCHVSSACTFTL